MDLTILEEAGFSECPKFGELRSIGFTALQAAKLKTLDVLAVAVKDAPPYGGSPFPSQVAAYRHITD